MEIMGFLSSDETLDDWEIKNAIFYHSCGKQGLYKICVLKKESSGYISFVMNEKKRCSDFVDFYL